MTERAKMERLRRLLQRRRLMFLQVSAKAGGDRLIPTMIDTHAPDGSYTGTVTSPEYNRLLRDIVKLLS